MRATALQLLVHSQHMAKTIVSQCDTAVKESSPAVSLPHTRQVHVRQERVSYPLCRVWLAARASTEVYQRKHMYTFVCECAGCWLVEVVPPRKAERRRPSTTQHFHKSGLVTSTNHG
jgi:hypothetical protein